LYNQTQTTSVRRDNTVKTYVWFRVGGVQRDTRSEIEYLPAEGLAKQNLKLDTTFINREYTNEYVYAQANNAMDRDGNKRIQKMTDFHTHRRKILLAKLITLGPDEPGARAALQDDVIAPHDYGKNRVGRKRKNWTATTIQDFWEETRHTFEEARGAADFNPHDPKHDSLMRKLAEQYDSKYHFATSNKM
jgi:hypothetical protein